MRDKGLTFQHVFERDDAERHDSRVDALQELFDALLRQDGVRRHALLPTTPLADFGQSKTPLLRSSRVVVLDETHFNVNVPSTLTTTTTFLLVVRQMVDFEVRGVVVVSQGPIVVAVCPFELLRALSLLLLLLLMGALGLVLAGARTRVAVAHEHAIAETLCEAALDSLLDTGSALDAEAGHDGHVRAALLELIEDAKQRFVVRNKRNLVQWDLAHRRCI